VPEQPDWAFTFDALAEFLLRRFASDVPGFRSASRPAIVRQFLRTPGHVTLDDRTAVIRLDPSPYHVALRTAGADASLARVPWLQERSVAFRLEGL
jgi:hypothetical protein